jgi:hypothetical protein
LRVKAGRETRVIEKLVAAPPAQFALIDGVELIESEPAELDPGGEDTTS